MRVGFFLGMLLAGLGFFFFGERCLDDGKSNRDDRLKELVVEAKAVLDSTKE